MEQSIGFCFNSSGFWQQLPFSHMFDLPTIGLWLERLFLIHQRLRLFAGAEEVSRGNFPRRQRCLVHSVVNEVAALNGGDQIRIPQNSKVL